jgi:hypothetical protein
MANPTRVNMTMFDDDQDSVQWGFWLPSSLNTIVGIEAAAQGVIEAAVPLMTGIPGQVQITYTLDTSGWTLTPSVAADQDRLVGARFIYRSSVTPNAKTEVNLPTFDKTTFTSPPGNEVDLTNASVIALLAEFVTNISTNQDHDVSVLVSAKETYGGKSR